MSITVDSYSPASGTHVFTARNAAGQWWNGSAFETYNAANIANYAITATSTGNGWYQGSLPDLTLTYGLRLRSGASLATTDPAIDVGTTALPRAAAGVSGGLPTVDASNNVHGLQTRTVSDATVIGTSTFATGGNVNVTQWGGTNVTGMPMPTYTQPAGFLTTTFASTVGTSTYAGPGTGLIQVDLRAINGMSVALLDLGTLPVLATDGYDNLTKAAALADRNPQPLAKPGDPMTLTGAYDRAKTAATPQEAAGGGGQPITVEQSEVSGT